MGAKGRSLAIDHSHHEIIMFVGFFLIGKGEGEGKHTGLRQRLIINGFKRVEKARKVMYDLMRKKRRMCL